MQKKPFKRNRNFLFKCARWSYNRRAGIEGTISQGVSAFGLRRSRYMNLAKTHLQHVLTSAAINVVRLVAWLQGQPHTKTRASRFASLALAKS